MVNSCYSLKNLLMVLVVLIFGCKTGRYFNQDHTADTNNQKTKQSEILATKAALCRKDNKLWHEETSTCVDAKTFCGFKKAEGYIFQDDLCLSPEQQCLLEKGSEWVDGICKSARVICEEKTDGSRFVNGTCLSPKEFCKSKGEHYIWSESRNECELQGFLNYCQDPSISQTASLTVLELRRFAKAGLQLERQASCSETHSYLKSINQLRLVYDQGDKNSVRIQDAFPLIEFSQLTQLELTNQGISDLSPLAFLADLEYLDLQNNELNDLSPLAGLLQLKFLFLGYNRNIISISSLKNLKKIEVLQIFSATISNLSPLEQLKSLKRLSLRDNPISSVYYLRLLENLELDGGLDLIYTNIARLPLEKRNQQNCPTIGDISEAVKKFCLTAP